jgi:tocopherol cyclase
MTGGNTTYEVEITATTHEVGTWLRGPHAEVGFVPMCRDACGGHLTLRIWRRQGIIDRTVAAVANAVGAQEERPRGELVLEAQSDAAAVEIGGGPWEHAWKTDCEVPSLILESLKLDL